MYVRPSVGLSETLYSRDLLSRCWAEIALLDALIVDDVQRGDQLSRQNHRPQPCHRHSRIHSGTY